MAVNVSLFLCYLSVFIDLLGVSIILPIITFLALEFKAGPFELGMIFAFYAGAQMISVPITGSLSDRFGRKPLLLLSLFGSFAGFVFQGLAPTLESFMAARALAGAFGGSIPICQAYIADTVPQAERPRYFAALGSTIALAFMLGPGIGAGLAQFSLRTPMFVSSGLAALGFLIAFFKFKEPKREGIAQGSLPQKKRRESSTEGIELQIQNQDQDTAKDEEMCSEAEAPSGAETKEAFHDWALYIPLRRLMWASSFMSQMSTATQLYFLALLFKERLDWGELEYGFFNMGTALVSVLIQLLLYPKIVRRVGRHGSAICGLLSIVISNVLFAFVGKGQPQPGVVAVDPSINSTSAVNASSANTVAPVDLSQFTNLPLMMLAGFFASLGFAIAAPSITAALSRYASDKEQGKTLGISQGLQALARTVAPPLYGALWTNNSDMPFFVGAGVAAAGAATIYVCLSLNRNLPEHAQKRARLTSGALLATLPSFQALKVENKELRERLAELTQRLAKYESVPGMEEEGTAGRGGGGGGGGDAARSDETEHAVDSLAAVGVCPGGIAAEH